MKRTTLHTPGVLLGLQDRIGGLQPNAVRRWGSMSAGGMLCHVGDAFALMLAPPGEAARPLLPWAARALARPLFLGVPLRWPHNLPTVPPLDQHGGGTPPGDFAQDRERLLKALSEFAAVRHFTPLRHPIFGPLTAWEWARWAWLHTDHHLRQFSA